MAITFPSGGHIVGNLGSGSVFVSGGTVSVIGGPYVCSGAIHANGGTLDFKSSTHLSFDGSGDYVDVGDKANLEVNAFTVAGWFYIDSASSGVDFLVCNSDGDTKGWRIYHYNNTLNFYRATSSVNTDVTNLKDQWIYVVGSYTSGELKLYIDGILEATNNPTGNPDYTSSKFQIGADGANGDTFQGDICQVKFFDSVLSEANVMLLYQNRYSATNPLGYWKLDEGSSATATDSGTGGNDGTVTNASYVNPTFEGGALQIGSAGTVSMPRGTYKTYGNSDFTYNEKNWNQHNSSTFTHNNGTVTFAYGDTGILNNSGWNGPFYDINNNASNTFNLRGSSKTKIDNDFLSSAGYWVMSNGAHLCVNNTISGNASNRLTYLTPNGNPTIYISGTSEVYPVTWKGYIPQGIHWAGLYSTAGMKTWKLSNIDFRGDDQTQFTSYSGTNLGGNNVASNLFMNGFVSVSGQVDVSGGAVMTMNNQKFEVVGATSDLYVRDTGKLYASGAHVYVEDKFKTTAAGSVIKVSGATLICGHTGTSTIRFNNASPPPENFFYNPKSTTGGVGFDTNNNVAYNMFVGASGAYFDMTDMVFNGVKNIMVASNGVLKEGNASSRMVISGNVGLRGGLIGHTLFNCDNGSTLGAGGEGYSVQWGDNADQSLQFGNYDGCLEGWFRTKATNSYRVLARSHNVGKWMFLNDGAKLVVYVTDFAGTAHTVQCRTYANLDIKNNEWYHVAAVFEETNIIVYINGRIAGTGTKADGFANKGSTNGWALGSNPGSQAYTHIGQIGYFRVWREARTRQEILDNMFKTDPIDDNNKLVANINFNNAGDGTGGTVYDAAGNGNGTIYTTGYSTTTDDLAWGRNAKFELNTGGKNAHSSFQFNNDGGTCTWFTDGLSSLPNLQIGSGTTFHYDNLTTNMYGNLNDRSVRLLSGSVFSGSNLHNNQFYMRRTAEASGTLYVEKDAKFKNGLILDGGTTMELPAASSTTTSFDVDNKWLRIGDGTASKITFTKDFTSTSNDGITTERNSILSINPGVTLDVKRVRAQGVDVAPGQSNSNPLSGSNIIFKEASKAIFRDSSGGFVDDDGSNRRLSFVASGEAAAFYDGSDDVQSTNTNYFSLGGNGEGSNKTIYGEGCDSGTFSWWTKFPSSSGVFDSSQLRAIWGLGVTFTGAPANGMPTITVQSRTLKFDIYTEDGSGNNHRGHSVIKNLTTVTNPYEWHHWALVIEPGSGADKIKCYLDGSEITTISKEYEFLNYASTRGLGFHGAPTNNTNCQYGPEMSIADWRWYSGSALTASNITTLASVNPALTANYADPTNTLGAKVWYKFDGQLSADGKSYVPASGNYGTAPLFTLRPYGTNKSGYVNFLKTGSGGGFKLLPLQTKTSYAVSGINTLQNTFISGSEDLVLKTNTTVNTKGKVVIY